MKRTSFNRALAALALSATAAMPAHATVVDFEDVLATLFSGSTVSSAGANFTSGGTAFSGVDTASAFAFGVAPPNSSGQFLFALNDDSLTLTAGGGTFRLLGFDAAFIPPLLQLPGTIAGQLLVDSMTAGGLISDAYDFGAADGSGAWNFSAITVNPLAMDVTSVTFTACVYDGLGGCSRNASLSQFALDNIRIPEPASAALTLAALGLLAATRRRQSC